MPAFLKAALALSLLPPLASAVGPQVYFTPDDPRIVQVICRDSPTYIHLGTAFRVGPHHYLSVEHVTGDGSACSIQGKPFTVAHLEQGRDFVLLTMKEDRPDFLRVDCEGFKANEEYVALGFARGVPRLTAVELVATGQYGFQADFAVLDGMATVIPGQSGGPIISKRTGRPVGMVNVYDSAAGLSGSRELKGTEICRHG